MVMVRALTSIALLLTSAAPAPQAEAVPSGLMAAARGRVVEFAMLLRHLSVPVGLEIYSGDRTPQRRPDFEMARGDLVPLAAVLEVFNATHTDYRAAMMDGVVVIRPAAGRASYLDQPLAVSDFVVTGVLDALRKIFAGLDPRLDSGGGIVSSRFVSGQEAGDFVTIALTPGGSVLRGLNEMARQSGQGWVVETALPGDTDDARIRFVGVMHAHGASSGLSIAGP